MKGIKNVALAGFTADVCVLGTAIVAYDSVSDARASLGRYLDYCNGRRPHSSLDGMTPDRAYCKLLPLGLAA